MALSTPSRKLPLAVILNNEIMPYRIPLFRALHKRSDIETRVLYSTARSWERIWTIDTATLDFPHRILPGFCLTPPKSRFSEKRSIYINPSLFFELIRLRPDVIVAYEFSVPSFTALLYTALTGRPLLIWSECTAISDRHLTTGQRLARKIIIPRAKGFFGTSPMACQNLIALGAPADRVVEAPQVHQVHWIRQQAAQARAVKPSAETLILYVGSLIERKGVMLLLDAFAKACIRHPSLRLRIVGEGPRRKILEKKTQTLGLQSRVEFVGFVEPAGIPFEYSQAGMFILPSLEETFGVVVVEALACDVPVICSSFAGVSTYLKDGESAFVVDPKDTSRLADRIGVLLENQPLRAQFVARGQEIAATFEASSVANVFAMEIIRTLERGME